MRSRSPGRSRRIVARAVVAAGLVALAAPLSACGVPNAIQDATDQIEATREAVLQEATAWRTVLPRLQADLTTMVEKQQGKITADVKQILADTTNDVSALAQDTIKVAGLTVDQLTARFGTEARCNVDFARSRVSSSLGTLAGRLKFWQKNKSLPPPPPHSVCQVTPDNVELRTTGVAGGWSMTYPADKVVGVYGYDFRGDAAPVVELQNRDGTKLRDAKASVSYVTRYQFNLDFGSEDFSLVAAGARYVLRWPDQPEPNAIAVTLIQPARLKILAVTVQPTARARADLVRPVVDVINDGGTNSGRFSILWNPGPNDPVQSLSIDNLGAGERRTFTFPGYVYRAAVAAQTDIVVGSGSDSWHGLINVTPYANMPQPELRAPIQGTWPDGGGDTGQTRKFVFPPIQLGPDCEIDMSRGGGGFEVSDINNDNVKYTIAWPPGYNLDFSGDGTTFWRSFHAITVNYDAQTRRATPTVTLKGLGGHGGLFPSRGPERFNGTFTVYSICPQ
jgi:hypothetical protein